MKCPADFRGANTLGEFFAGSAPKVYFYTFENSAGAADPKNAARIFEVANTLEGAPGQPAPKVTFYTFENNASPATIQNNASSKPVDV